MIRLRKRNTGVLAFFFLAVMILMLVSPTMVYAGEFDNARDFYNKNDKDVVYNTSGGRGYFYYAVRGSTGGTTNTTLWRTLGFRWKISNAKGNSYMYFNLEDPDITRISRVESGSYLYQLFRIEYDTIESRLYNTNTSVWREFLKSGATITVDSCMTTVNVDSRGRETINGTMYSNGSTSGKAYYTYEGIAGAANWSNPSSLKSYFNKVVKFRVSLPKDTTAPSGYFTPNSASWTNGNVSPKFTPTDNTGGSGVDRWRYRKYTNGSWGSWSGWNWSVASGFGTLAQGTHRFQVEVRDKAGNVGTVTSGYYYIDKTTPTVTASPSTRGWGNTNVTVKLTYKDTGGSGLNIQQCKWSTSTARPTSWANYSSYPNGVSTGTAGTSYLHYRVSDKAGNIRYGYFGPYRIDKVAPTHQNHSLTGYDYKNGNDYWVKPNTQVSIRMRGYEALSGMKYNYIRLLGANADVRSNHDWTKAANHNNQFSTSPRISIDSASRTYNSGNNKEITWKVTPKNYSDIYNIQYYYRDNASNIVGYKNTGMRLGVDNAAPNITITQNPTTWTNQDVDITAIAKDSQSGVKDLVLIDGPEDEGNLAGNGKNLVLKSNTPANSTEYRVTGYDMSTDWAAGETWTVTIKGKVNSGQRFRIWANGSQTAQTYLTDIGGDIHTATFTVKEPVNKGENAGPRKLNIYNYPNTTAKSSSVEWVKLEKGSKRSNWSPAPADIISGFANRNLLRDSATLALIGSDYPTKINSTFNNNTGVGKIAVNGTGTINAYRFGTIANNDIYNDVGEKYIASIDVKASGSGDYTFAIDTRNASNGERTNSTFAEIPMTNEWTRISAEFIVPNNDASRTLFIFRSNNASVGDVIEYRNIKVEKGPATAHSLAPEDAEKSVTHTVTQNGTYTFLATDNVGNISKKSIVVSNIDKEDPIFNKDEDFKVEARYIEGENNYWIRANDTAELRLKGTDTGSGIKKSYIRAHDGDQDIRSLHDWNIGKNHNDNFMTGNKLSFIAAEEVYNYGATKEVSFTAKSSNIDTDFDLYYYFRDYAGNYIGYGDTGKNLRIDVDAPTVTAIPERTIKPTHGDWENKSSGVSVQLIYEDHRSGVKTRQYAWSELKTAPISWSNYTEDLALNEEGVWYLHYKTTDNVDNERIGYFGPYKIDKTAPTGIASKGFDGEILTVSTTDVVDNLSGVKRVWLTVSDGSKTVEKTLVKNAEDATKFSGQVNINEEFARSKTVTFKVYAEDIAGNIRELKSDVFDTFTVNATVRRVLDGDRNEPYIPTFRNGEAGVLEIKMTGFVQELVVVFPDGLVDDDEDGVGVKENTVILRKDKTDESVTYGKSDEDQYVFFVPLKIEDGLEDRDEAKKFTINVTAIKNDMGEDDSADLFVSGSVLNQIRTRLR